MIERERGRVIGQRAGLDGGSGVLLRRVEEEGQRAYPWRKRHTQDSEMKGPTIFIRVDSSSSVQKRPARGQCVGDVMLGEALGCDWVMGDGI